MVSRIEQVRREGFTDVTSRLGETGRRLLPSGSRGVIRLRPGVSLSQISRREFETGQFSSANVLNPLTVITNPGRIFVPRVPIGAGRAGTRLTQASIRALRARGTLAPRPGTIAGLPPKPIPRTVAEKKARQEALRQIARSKTLQQQRQAVRAVGGFSSITGETQIVTPTGRVVRTITQAKPIGFRDVLLKAFRESSKRKLIPQQPTNFLEAEARILDSQFKALEAKNRALDAKAKQLDAQSQVANISTATLVNFNEQIRQQEQRVSRFNTRVARFNAKLPKRVTPRLVAAEPGVLKVDTKFDKFSKQLQQSIFRTATDIQGGLRLGGANFVNLFIKGRDFTVGKLTKNQQTTINNAFLKSPDPKIRAAAPFLFTGVTLKGTNKEKFDQALKDLGSAGVQVGSLAAPFPLNIIAGGSAIIASNKPVDAAASVGIGLLFGGAAVFLGKGSRLVKLLLGTGKAGKVYAVAERTTGGILIPLYFVAEGTKAGTRIIEASLRGERKRVKDVSTQTASDFASFIIGQRIGTGLTERLVTPIEGRLILANAVLKLPKAQQNKFKKYFETAQEFANIKVKPINPKTSIAERIPDKAGKIIDSFIKRKPNLVLGGSVSAAFQVPLRVRIKLPKPSDVDLYGRGNTWRTNARELFLLLKRAKIPRVSLLTKGARAEITIQGKKAIEFHSIDKLIQNIRATRALFDISARNIVRTPNGTRMLKLSLQAKRKIIGAFTDARAKDIVQFEALAKVLKPSQRKAALERAAKRGVLRVSFSGLLPRINLRLSDLLKFVPKTTRLRIRSLLSQLKRAVGNKALRIATRLKTILRTSLRTVVRKINLRIRILRNRLKKATVKAKNNIRKRIDVEIRLLKKLLADEAGYISLLTIGKPKVKRVRKKKRKKVRVKKRRVIPKIKRVTRKVTLKQSREYNHYFKRSRGKRKGRSVFSYRKLRPNRTQMAAIAFYNNLTPRRRRNLAPNILIGRITYPKTQIIRTRLLFLPDGVYTSNLRPQYPPVPNARTLPGRYATLPPKAPGYPPARRTTRVPPPEKLPVLPPLSFDKQVDFILRSKRGFNVLVRTKVKGKSKFIRKNKKPLTGSSALALGQRITDRDPRRSFFVAFSKRKGAFKLNLPSFKRKRYRKPKGVTKLPIFAFVERSAFAISSKGEIRGISRKGQQALRRRRKGKRKNNPSRNNPRRKVVRRFKRKIIVKRNNLRRRIVKRKKIIRRRPVKRKKSKPKTKAFLGKLGRINWTI